MKAIKDLLRAQQDLLQAQENLPADVREAAKKLSEKTDLDYFGALEILSDLNLEATPTAPTKQVEVTKSRRKKRRTRNMSDDAKKELIRRNKTVKGFGGQVNPKGLLDIKRRIKSADTEAKQHCYRAAYELFKSKGEWVPGEKLRKLGIDTKHIRNKRRMTACLPRGFVFQSSAHGYRACDLSEALA